MGRVTKLSLIVCAALLSICSQALATSYSELFVQQATSGHLKKVGKNFELDLTLSSGNTLGFTDRPGRRGRSLSTTSFVSNWKSYGFKQDPPNAALSIDGASKKRDLLLLKLQSPRMSKGHVIYKATPLNDAPGYGLKQFEKKADKASELSFGQASLFIDPTNAVTQVTLSISNTNPGVSSVAQIQINSDTDLVWSTTGANPNSPGFEISGPYGQALPFAQFALNGKQLEIVSQPGSSMPSNFNIVLYLQGSSQFFEGVANIGPGWQINATINGVTTTWSSGIITAALE